MARRTGSFPLMNLAEDLGVDYGDILLIADHHRRLIRREGLTAARRLLVDAAFNHILFRIGSKSAHRLLEQLRRGAERRWVR